MQRLSNWFTKKHCQLQDKVCFCCCEKVKGSGYFILFEIPYKKNAICKKLNFHLSCESCDF